MKITVLLENNISSDADTRLKLKSAHGLSLYIESGGRKLPISIGLDHKIIENNSERICFIEEDLQLTPEIQIFEGIFEDFPRPASNGNLCSKVDGSFHRDDFAHELVLQISEKQKEYIFTGCSHSGIVNMVDKVISFTQSRRKTKRQP